MYDIYVGKQRSIVFPIMCNAHVVIPYAENIVDIEGTPNEIGFLADEVVSVIPEIVPFGPKSFYTKNESDTEEIPVNVDYRRMTAVLTKALQEAVAKIETLEAKVAALEGS